MTIAAASPVTNSDYRAVWPIHITVILITVAIDMVMLYCSLSGATATAAVNTNLEYAVHMVRMLGFLTAALIVLFLGMKQQLVLGAAYGAIFLLHLMVVFATDKRYVSTGLAQALGY